MYMNLLLEILKVKNEQKGRKRGNEMKRAVYYKGYNSFSKKRRRKQKVVREAEII
jgi:hypothetical protein